jgi:hypothetical protein
MSEAKSRLQVLLVEDEPDDLKQYERDFPAVFVSCGVDADIHPCHDFDDAFNLTSNPLNRFDLIVSDTYRNPVMNRDPQVLRMVENYRGNRFCPLVIYSSSVMPPELHQGPFLVWADKSKPGDIERAMRRVLETRIPQLARKLHDELEGSAGSYLWTLLEEKWDQLNTPSPLGADVLERMVRRRAAIQIGDIDPSSGTASLRKRHAPEYYIYPAFRPACFNLGDVLRAKEDAGDWRVILTPHCHLVIQSNQVTPRADHVLLVKAIRAEEVLGDKIEKAKGKGKSERAKKLAKWTQSPARIEGQPDGRHWYLPGFLDIPHSFCDFLQVQSVPHDKVVTDFECIATLVPPYAEALQSCFATFYSSVGLPEIQTESIMSLLA